MYLAHNICYHVIIFELKYSICTTLIILDMIEPQKNSLLQVCKHNKSVMYVRER